MRVVAHDHNIANHSLAELVDTDDELFALADYLSLHLPLTPETRGILNWSAFARMKPGVVIINTARGRLVVEEDLAEALRSGRVAAYATDVWLSDPPDPGSPLLSAPNVIMTPHIGASSRENLLRIGDTVVDILSHWKS
jgi:phosphoglycerate dehydrogenase-like enzyme